jgi:hypothetical protein
MRTACRMSDFSGLKGSQRLDGYFTVYLWVLWLLVALRLGCCSDRFRGLLFSSLAKMVLLLWRQCSRNDDVSMSLKHSMHT